MDGNSRSAKGSSGCLKWGGERGRRVSAKTGEDHIRLKVIMYLSGAVFVHAKDKNDI